MKKLATRSAQWPLTAEFVFNYNDWVVDSVDGVKKTFGSTVANSVDPTEPGLIAATGVVFDAIKLPRGAYITGAEALVEQAFVGIGAGATLSLGIAGATTAIVNAADLDAATAGSKLTVANFNPGLANAGADIRLTTAGLAAAATAGKVRVRISYTIDERANEVIPN